MTLKTYNNIKEIYLKKVINSIFLINNHMFECISNTYYKTLLKFIINNNYITFHSNLNLETISTPQGKLGSRLARVS